MEIFAQWLDDLDDALAALPLVWAWLRIRCLQAGFMAALALALTSPVQPPLVVAGVTSGIAFGSVLIWLGSVAISAVHRMSRRA